MKRNHIPMALLSGLAALSPLRCWAELAVPGARLNVDPAKIAGNDTLAWMLIGVLGMTLGMVGACGWGICRRFGRKPTPEQELLDEIKNRLSRASGNGSAPGLEKLSPDSESASWEKPGDWWKNPPPD